MTSGLPEIRRRLRLRTEGESNAHREAPTFNFEPGNESVGHHQTRPRIVSQISFLFGYRIS